MKISVSFIKSKYNEKDTVNLIDKTDAEYVHIDLMDGKFVEHKNYTVNDIKNIVNGTNKKLDVHLMCKILANILKILHPLTQNT